MGFPILVRRHLYIESDLNIMMLFFQYRNSHYKGKTVWWLSYLYNGNPYSRKDGLYIEMGPRSLLKNFIYHDDTKIICLRKTKNTWCIWIEWIVHHDDVIKWKHFPHYWPFVRGIHRSLVNSTHKSQWRGALMFSLICVWINSWVNNREAGDLRRYHAHYDVTVMTTIISLA